MKADAKHDYQAMMRLSDGTIHQIWQWWQWELGSCNCPPDKLSIERLKVTHKSRRTATVDVLAKLISSGTTTIGGPMTLRRAGVSWVVHDYRRNGIDFARSIAARQGHQTSRHIDVRLLGVDRDPISEDVWFRITNNGSDPISLAAFTASSGSTKLTPSQYNPAVKNLPPNMWMVTNLLWKTRHKLPADSPLNIHLVFVDLVTGARVSVSIPTLS